LEIGAPVCVVGLKRQVRFNDQVGKIIDASATAERLLVRLPEDHFGTVLALLPENLRPLPSGSLVELFGLNVTELNGMVGTVQSSLHGGKSEILRYLVKLADGSEKSLKATNLKPRAQLWNLGAALSAGRKPAHAHLQWRNEHSCLFI
jgi:hypothetical protein